MQIKLGMYKFAHLLFLEKILRKLHCISKNIAGMSALLDYI